MDFPLRRRTGYSPHPKTVNPGQNDNPGVLSVSAVPLKEKKSQMVHIDINYFYAELYVLTIL
jgi:hypothetical protein